MHQFVGIYAVLDYLGPFWTFAILYTAFVIIVWPMRWITEGRTYNVSRGHLWGDACLSALIAISVGFLPQQNIIAPSWLSGSIVNQLFVFVLCEVAALIAWFKFLPHWKDTFSEKYHAVITVPVLLFLIIISVAPAASNKAGELLSLQAFLLNLWFVLVSWDFENGRAKQQEWLANNPNYWWVIHRK